MEMEELAMKVGKNSVVFWKALSQFLFCRVCEGNASKAFVLSTRNSDDLVVVYLVHLLV